MISDEERLNEISERIIGCAFKVSNVLGVGFLKKVYENALALELRKAGLSVAQQQAVVVMYEGVAVGEYVADLIVGECIIVEVKYVRELERVHLAQGLNYLKATNLHRCLLINFGKPRIEIRRISL